MAAKLVRSTIKPASLYIDKVERGRSWILCRWGITEIHETDIENPFDGWEYMESGVWWTFPDSFTDVAGATRQILTEADLQAYLDLNHNEIMSYARAVKISGIRRETQIELVDGITNEPLSKN